ncbi:hypothetical protein [Rhodobium gokarnense]|uniref:Uncharacterized protein n=1 Tax=Rhodobium gokarnense TaxID=364296 RepID=A0ABT3HEN3_9HYPH|nr:hypothetical protein [Rhodobium gokarnense]MCW2308857.1 hypothetical protein [Rhodobium gokarnense]
MTGIDAPNAAETESVVLADATLLKIRRKGQVLAIYGCNPAASENSPLSQRDRRCRGSSVDSLQMTRLLGAPVPLVLGAMGQKITAKLPDMVFDDRDHRRMGEDRFPHPGVTSDVLFVAGLEAAESRLVSSRSTSLSLSFAPSMRVEKPMLTMVATRRQRPKLP